MDISYYGGYFHDGYVLDILHIDQKVDLLLQSTILLKEWEKDISPDIILSRDNSIQGILHIEDVKEIRVNKNKFTEPLRKMGSVDEILDLEVHGKTILLNITSVNPKTKKDRFVSIEIDGGAYWWENIPNLTDKHPAGRPEELLRYLDKYGQPCAINSPASHLYPPAR
jgi:hypothetical protein